QNKWIFNWNTKKEAVNKNDFSFFHSPVKKSACGEKAELRIECRELRFRGSAAVGILTTL
uniref:hypothetical protein n=1 Tax=uncultured Dialister sp. TaxID=278064 RepID=UPI0025EA8E2F